MKNQSVTLAVYKLSNDCVGISIDQKQFEQYVKQLNTYQKNPITYYKQEKKYSHVKNNDLMCAVKDYFKNQKTVVFDKKGDIQNVSDLEMVLLKNNPQLKTEGFEYEKALKFLQLNNLMEIFLEGKLEKNIISQYNEYSRSFSNRVNIKNVKQYVTSLQEIDNHLTNSVLIKEEKAASVYDYYRESRIISFSHEKYHTYLHNNQDWVKQLFEENQNKNGFPHAQGNVFEDSFLELLKTVQNKTKNSFY